jgi:F0F1-type ATP synthase membrane subunit a
LVSFFSAYIINLEQQTLFVELVEGDTNWFYSFVLFVFEGIAIIFRPITLTLRLLVNLVVGHCFHLIIYRLFLFRPFWGWIGLVLVFLLELIVVLIQIYVFITLLLYYLGE